MSRTRVFTKINYLIMAAGMLAVIAGFSLMCGNGSTAAKFETDIFSFRRIAIAPVISLIGFVCIGSGILYRKHK